MDKWERLTIADALETVEFEDGEDVFTKGDAGREFFIILEGYQIMDKPLWTFHKNKYKYHIFERHALVHDITKDEKHHGKDKHKEEAQQKMLGEGDYFGEVALLLNTPRSASVTASGHLKCAKLDNLR